MYIMTEKGVIINCNYYDHIRVELSPVIEGIESARTYNIIANNPTARVPMIDGQIYIATFEKEEHAEEALASLFRSLKKGEFAWDARGFKQRIEQEDELVYGVAGK